MAQILNHNMAAQVSLGELNKNISKLGQAIAKVAGGQKITGAKDDSASFAISEIMRVKIRALEQATQNVQNGNALLRTAEEGIQQQIDILRTIREKVIDACNDTNTDADRLIIQKEINQFYDQMDQTAYYTDYNTKKVLLGDKIWYKSARYISAGENITDPKSAEMNLIPDNFPMLDGVEGPFDIFTEYGTYSDTAKILTGISPEHSVKFIAGANGTAKEMTVDLSGYTLSQLQSQNTGFYVTARSSSGYTNYARIVLTTDTTQNFRNAQKKVDISGCNSVADVATELANAMSSYFGSSYLTTETNGNVITLKSANESSESNYMNVTAFNANAETIENTTGSTTEGSATGVVTSTNGKMSGGSNQIGSPFIDDPDMQYIPAKFASISPINISKINTPTGITINGWNTAYLEFQEGTAGLSYDSEKHIYTVGKDATVSNQQVDSTRMNLTLQNGQLSFTASEAGAAANNYKIVDGYTLTTYTGTGTFTDYSAVVGNTATVTTTVEGEDSNSPAYYDIDLSSYDDVEEFISDLTGKNLLYSSSYTYSYSSRVNFYDSAADSQTTKSLLATSNNNLDLNLIRQDVAEGKSIAESFATRFKSVYGYSSYVSFLDENGDEVTYNSDTAIMRITSRQLGSRGNNDILSIWSTQFRHYDINYSDWFANNSSEDVADSLDGKGFRFYCATDANQWFNIIFTTTAGLERPKSDAAISDIKSIEIDVSQVRDAASLVQAIYDQAMPILTGEDPLYNHHYRFATDTDAGILTVYDQRNWNVNIEGYDYQEMGAKIADGYTDNVVKVRKNILCRDLIIQDTDKASMNLRIKIPDTKVDTIFDIMPDYGKKSVRDYSLTVKEDRDALIGNGKNTQGILDTGLEYLLNAAVMVGAQRARLEFDGNNLISQTENTISSESTIRDADMAKEMANYTKYNVLSQSAQAMLAQANQNMSGVLNLLQ